MIFELWLHVISAGHNLLALLSSLHSARIFTPCSGMFLNILTYQQMSQQAPIISLYNSNRCIVGTSTCWLLRDVNCNLAELSPTNHLRTHSERSIQSGHLAVIALVIFSFILNTWIHFCNYSVFFILNKCTDLNAYWRHRDHPKPRKPPSNLRRNEFSFTNSSYSLCLIPVWSFSPCLSRLRPYRRPLLLVLISFKLNINISISITVSRFSFTYTIIRQEMVLSCVYMKKGSICLFHIITVFVRCF